MKVVLAKKSLKSLVVAGLMTTVVGCATSTETFTKDDRKNRVQTDLGGLYAGQTPVTNAMTLGEAIARSLNYNLDHRLKKMEAAVY